MPGIQAFRVADLLQHLSSRSGREGVKDGGKNRCDLSKHEDPRQKAQGEIFSPRLERIDIIDWILIKSLIWKDSSATKSIFTS